MKRVKAHSEEMVGINGLMQIYQSWWITDPGYEKVKFKDIDGSIEYSAWWIAPTIKTNKDAIIIVHGYGASKHEYTVLMPAAMLVRNGHNVLVIDSRLWKVYL